MKKAFKMILLILPLCLLLVMSGCGMSAKMLEYYSDKENYVNASGTLTYMKISEEHGMGLGFSDLDPKFSATGFRIAGENLTVVLNNGLDKALSLGDHVEFVSATRYFGDGYLMPIVSITVDGVEYLSFEEGYENYLHWLKGQKNSLF